jgi:DNA polymerase elongation subunit (family B)
MAKGFITNTNYKVEGDKAIVQVYGKLDNGESFLVENPYKPYFYIKETDQKKAEKLAPIEYQTSNFKNFNNEALTKVTLGNPKTTNEIRKLCSDNKIANYEVDIKFPSRFLIDHKILSTINIEGTKKKQKNCTASHYTVKI